MKEILEILQARASHPEVPFALATVVRVEGSSYRRPGARMLIGMNGRIAGSVSGGCLERDVVSKGLHVLMSGTPELASYDTTDQDDLVFGTSLGCQGRIDIWVEPLLPRRAWPLQAVVERVLREQRPCALATPYGGEGRGQPFSGACFTASDETFPAFLNEEHASDLRRQMDEILVTKKARAISYVSPDYRAEMLLERIAPPISLILFGGGYDVPPLVRLAKEMGHHVTVIDRRADFADPARFPGADAVLHAKPHQALERISLHDRSALVLMNHHYETDRDLLGILHAAPAAYIGMLGPRKRTAKIIQELKEDGIVLSEEEIARLHAPAGLDIGSENPEEIALSILAEIQATLSGRNASYLRDRPAPIHVSERAA